MPTSSGRADPFNPWLEAQQDTVIYQSAGWLGMDCLPAQAAPQLHQLNTTCHSDVQALLSFYQSCACFSTELFSRCEPQHIWAIKCKLVALLAPPIYAVVAALCSAVPCPCSASSRPEATAAGGKILRISVEGMQRCYVQQHPRELVCQALLLILQGLVYSSTFCIGLYAVYNEPWSKDTSYFWRDWPHQHFPYAVLCSSNMP